MIKPDQRVEPTFSKGRILKKQASERAVFLDRDGVLIRSVIRDGKPYSITSNEEFHILSGVWDALMNLAEAGYRLIVVTNQPDVARGHVSRVWVESINDRLKAELPLDEVFTCFHDDKDGCVCRKPAPGLLLEAAREFGVDLKKSYMIGDRWRDIEAGQQAGCKTFFIDYGLDEKRPSNYDFGVMSLLQAAHIILGE